MLFGWQEAWARNNEVAKAIVFVTAAQMLCGIAKDLTKLGGKTVTKLVTPDEKEVTTLLQIPAYYILLSSCFELAPTTFLQMLL